ncbi:MAG: RNA polymerase sigma factor [Planctomycetota bacterium]|jgi:RNA polymerase sigma-70 factor (ECF subfamily)
MDVRSTRASLLARLADQDELAWHEFQVQYGDLIRSVAARRGLQPADAEDVVQDVLTRLTGKLPGFAYDPDKGTFRGYLKRIVLNTIADRFRRKRGPDAVPLGPGPTEAASASELDRIWEEQWQAYHVARAMRTVEVEFSERDRLAFLQQVRYGRSGAETAAALEMSTHQVYRARSQIMRRLRELVAAQVEEEG